MANNRKMSYLEKRAVLSLSAIMGLRMLGLFIVLPLFSLYARQLQGATPTLIGLAAGVYGLSQALLQIPFGTLSDRFGRKPLILIGLLIFAAGSILAACAHSISTMILGRALQGAGAVGSSLLAMIADSTTESQRTKSMAIAGISIGLFFSAAILLGPLLTKWLAVNELFFLAAGCGLAGIIILYTIVPVPPVTEWRRDITPERKGFLAILLAPDLIRLNTGIFCLHAIFTASFFVIPLAFEQFIHLPANRQWLIYLPALLIALFISLFCISLAERKQQIKPYFLTGIAALTLSTFLLWLAPANMTSATFILCLFLSGFTLLEAFLPSLISRAAPASRKGTALGIYSSAQFLGIFIGGALGGWLFEKFSFPGVYFFCIMCSFFWLILAYQSQFPRYLVTQAWRLSRNHQAHWQGIVDQLQILPGMIEVAFIAEEGAAYLKMESSTTKHPDFIRLKEQLQLQSNIN